MPCRAWLGFLRMLLYFSSRYSIFIIFLAELIFSLRCVANVSFLSKIALKYLVFVPYGIFLLFNTRDLFSSFLKKIVLQFSLPFLLRVIRFQIPALLNASVVGLLKCLHSRMLLPK
uniref:Putative product n=1 Tax=Xenopsylla cheopis TaxID=163159 RepID=A0A6M2DYW5_XENCH